MVFLAICRWMFKFHCATYPVFKFGFIRSSAVCRVAAGVRAGLAGWAGSGAPVPMRTSLPEVELGRSEEHTSELQSLRHLVCRLLLVKQKLDSPPTSQEHTPSLPCPTRRLCHVR